MRLRLFFLIISLFALSANAVPRISQQQAMEKAKAFMEQRQSYGAKTRNGQTINFVAAETGMTHLYAFNASDEGFVIVSANDCSNPIPGQYDTLTIDDNATGISTVKDKPSTTEAIYDLQGRRFNGQPTRGIYIKDNRKIMIK